MPSSPFTVALDVKAALGECPVWSVADRALWFVDIKGRALHRFDPASGDHRVKRLPEEIGCFAPATDGGFVAGLRSGIWRLSADGTPVEMLAGNPEDQATSRFNDGRTDPAGRFLAGTIDEPKAGGKAHLYRFDHRGLAVLAEGLQTSNGLAFSPDGRTLYHSDTPRFTVFAYDYDVATGTPTNRRIFARLEPRDGDRGRPDGAAVDTEGCYWTALYEGARVQRYAPDGRLMAEFPVPSQCPTMVAFGGDDLRTLFVTSARDGRPDDELAALPHSGALFSMRTDVAGRPDPLFDPAA
jgi:sugar lactone lactonase YvrE